MRTPKIIVAVLSLSALTIGATALASGEEIILQHAEGQIIFQYTCATPDHDQAREELGKEQDGQQDEQRQPLITEHMKDLADINDDGLVNIDDMVILLAGWGNCPAWSELSCQGDINEDFIVDFNDLALMLMLWDAADSGPVIELPTGPVIIVVQPGQVSSQKQE